MSPAINWQVASGRAQEARRSKQPLRLFRRHRR
jgi:hypothetical protein